jgi:hypothetical protein
LSPILASKSDRRPAVAGNVGGNRSADPIKHGDRFIRIIFGAFICSKRRSMGPEPSTRNSIAGKIPNMSVVMLYSSENTGIVAEKHHLKP